MADVRAQLSILDRLLDDTPRQKEEPPITVAQAMRRLRESVRRDLEWLLNTRCLFDDLADEFEEVRASVYTYGLPDFTSYGFGAKQTALRARRALEQALETFEPRLMNVTVTPIAIDKEEEKRILRFLISGLLRVDPAPEIVSYETVLEVSRGEFRITKA
jgi:type VI secretion system protein ImpF